MEIIFATKERWRALKYIKEALPKYDINEETAKVVLDMVSEHKIRVGDPFMYKGRVPIYPDKNYKKEDGEILNKWLTELKKKEEL